MPARGVADQVTHKVIRSLCRFYLWPERCQAGRGGGRSLLRTPSPRRNAACGDRADSAAAGTTRASAQTPRSPGATAGARTTASTAQTRRATSAPRPPGCGGSPARGGIDRRPRGHRARPRCAAASARCRRPPGNAGADLPTAYAPSAGVHSSRRGGTTEGGCRAQSRGSRTGPPPGPHTGAPRCCPWACGRSRGRLSLRG